MDPVLGRSADAIGRTGLPHPRCGRDATARPGARRFAAPPALCQQNGESWALSILYLTVFDPKPDLTFSAAGSPRRFARRSAEKTEEFRARPDQKARVAGLQRRLIGLHRAIEGEEIRILAESLGEDAVALGVAFALGLVGLALRLGLQHDHVAIGLGGDVLRLLGALGAILGRLARTLGLHAADRPSRRSAGADRPGGCARRRP